MRMLRLVFAVAILSVAMPGRAADELELTQRIAASGTPGLALERVKRYQPASASAQGWAEWEALRVTLLSQLGRDADLLARVAQLPPGAPEALQRQALQAGAKAALKTGRGVLARDYLARLLWQVGIAPEQERPAREMVIDAFLVEDNVRDAYLAMLRYQQDYKPLSRETSQKFTAALAARGLYREAVGFAGGLEDTSPLRFFVRYKAGLVTADDALAQARAAQKKSTNQAWWAVLRDLGLEKGDAALSLEAGEHLLNLPGERERWMRAPTADDLWREYIAAAEPIANKSQILAGDDAGWLALVGRPGLAPAEARALLAWLATRGSTAEARTQALGQLLDSLQQARLPRTALLLAGDPARFPQLPPAVRGRLGVLALDAGDDKVIARSWQALPAPSGVSADDWNLRLALVLARSGSGADAADLLDAYLTGRQQLPLASATRVLEIAQEGLTKASAARIEATLGRLAPLAEPAYRREVLFWMGRAAELRGEPALAADYFLQAASLVESRSKDSLAQAARLKGAQNLARAGLTDDAKAQYQWLLGVTRDSGQQEMIRREMKKL